jgi:hypothetical protein
MQTMQSVPSVHEQRAGDSPAAHTPLAVSLDDAAQVDAGRRSAAASLYQALLESLPEQDQRWVLDVVARHRAAEREAEERGEVLPGPAW